MNVDNLAMDHPEIGEIQKLFETKLYHQVYQKIDDFLSSTSSKQQNCLDYLENLLIPENVDAFNWEALGYNIHSLEYSQLCQVIAECKKAADPGMAIKFTDKALGFLQTIRTAAQAERETQAAEIGADYAEAEMVLKTSLACLKFDNGVRDEAKAVLREGETFIANKRHQYKSVDTQLYQAHYELAMQLYRYEEVNAPKFLESTLKFLSYTPLDSLDSKVQMGLARDIIHAAIFSEDTFNFGKVLFHPIMNSLTGSPHEDLQRLLRAFDNGDMNSFDQYKKCLETHQPLSEEQKKQLEEKMRLMALMVMFWKLETSQRVVSFRTIEQTCKITPNKVEIALMKAMSKKLIEGQINQVEQNVVVTKVQPRDIDQAGVGEIIEKVDVWLTSIDQLVETYDLGLQQR